jgi:vitamin B12 transporter
MLNIKTTMLAAPCLALAATGPLHAAIAELEEIVVTASRIEMPLRVIGSSISVLKEEEIQLRGYPTLADTLRVIPSVTVSRNGPAGSHAAIRIRGEEGYRTRVMIDGVDTGDPTGTQVLPHITHQLSYGIERVEVLRGPQGMMYGADAGGVVNIITRKAESEFEGGLTTEYGRYDSRLIASYLGGKLGDFDYAVQVSDVDSDGFNSQASDDVARDEDGYENTTIHARAGLQISRELRVELIARSVDADTEFDDCNFSGCPVSGGQDAYGEHEQDIYKGSLTWKGDKVQHRLSASTHKVERLSVTSFGPWETEGSTNEYQYNVSAPVADLGTVVAGVDYEDQEDDVNKVDQDQTGVYVEWQHNVLDRLFYTVGVRHDDNSDFGEHTSYRATAAYFLPVGDDKLKLKASYGTGFRAPSLFEANWNNNPWIGPPAFGLSLKEEESEGYDFGFEYRSESDIALELVYFNQEIEDEIVYDFVSGGYLQGEGTAESSGIEMGVEVPVGANWFINGNYTYNDTEDSDGNQRARRPEDSANLGIRFVSDNEKLTLAVYARLVRDVVDVGGVELDDYDVVDFTASYQLTEQIKFYTRVENAFDEDYQEVTGYNTPGAAVYGGVKLQF